MDAEGRATHEAIAKHNQERQAPLKKNKSAPFSEAKSGKHQ